MDAKRPGSGTSTDTSKPGAPLRITATRTVSALLGGDKRLIPYTAKVLVRFGFGAPAARGGHGDGAEIMFTKHADAEDDHVIRWRRSEGKTFIELMIIIVMTIISIVAITLITMLKWMRMLLMLLSMMMMMMMMMTLMLMLMLMMMMMMMLMMMMMMMMATAAAGGGGGGGGWWRWLVEVVDGGGWWWWNMKVMTAAMMVMAMMWIDVVVLLVVAMILMSVSRTTKMNLMILTAKMMAVVSGAVMMTTVVCMMAYTTITAMITMTVVSVMLAPMMMMMMMMMLMMLMQYSGNVDEDPVGGRKRYTYWVMFKRPAMRTSTDMKKILAEYMFFFKLLRSPIDGQSVVSLEYEMKEYGEALPSSIQEEKYERRSSGGQMEETIDRL
ncbi:hypothetical protein AK812_SmicGene12940 [Symbiodinium microadriaticum]|uniref:Uncharacterized protein n=1 Tax=Symbiodinium microadriaticum TaxID=2951 RepID=A0A1Q9E9D3_SYMMI|nr:hypothetical protein AK812_SmicGene12940 [Symbiodinium microadriaticum]